MGEGTITNVANYDKLAELVHGPTIAQQQSILIDMLKTFIDAEKFAPEIDACNFFRCKKPDAENKPRYIFQIKFSQHGLL